MHPLYKKPKGAIASLVPTDYLAFGFNKLPLQQPFQATFPASPTTFPTMKFTAVILALCAMCASAFIAPSAVVKSGSFVAPAVQATSTVAPKTAMNMGLEQIADILPMVPAEAHNQVLEIANSPLLLSLRADSFGGLIGPIGGCLAVATFIVVMAPPRVD